ncbi:hypothetical protein PMIN01_07132 [Paraphaeosphaeria minitans]|uniref:Uncharacterized protein n=1 Tax=Paraphaeosphaeria minitans TaxID=565426 RepID=A0A9P6KQ41_9PLEO|nr:hypothetical protein PMIN01_07132 [Paraphaeosphaeria minitans]
MPTPQTSEMPQEPLSLRVNHRDSHSPPKDTHKASRRCRPFGTPHCPRGSNIRMRNMFFMHPNKVGISRWNRLPLQQLTASLSAHYCAIQHDFSDHEHRLDDSMLMARFRSPTYAASFSTQNTIRCRSGEAMPMSGTVRYGVVRPKPHRELLTSAPARTMDGSQTAPHSSEPPRSFANAYTPSSSSSRSFPFLSFSFLPFPSLPTTPPSTIAPIPCPSHTSRRQHPATPPSRSPYHLATAQTAPTAVPSAGALQTCLVPALLSRPVGAAFLSRDFGSRHAASAAFGRQDVGRAGTCVSVGAGRRSRAGGGGRGEGVVLRRAWECCCDATICRMIHRPISNRTQPHRTAPLGFHLVFAAGSANPLYVLTHEHLVVSLPSPPSPSNPTLTITLTPTLPPAQTSPTAPPSRPNANRQSAPYKSSMQTSSIHTPLSYISLPSPNPTSTSHTIQPRPFGHCLGALRAPCNERASERGKADMARHRLAQSNAAAP